MTILNYSDISTPQQWAQDFLNTLGAPVTPTNESEVVAWEKVEGGNWNNTATFNPLNTSLQEPGSTNYQSQAPGTGVQSYTSWAQGIDATIATLEEQQPGYAAILADLIHGNTSQSQFASDVGLSAWDAGHYAGSTGVPGSTLATALGTTPANQATLLAANKTTPSSSSTAQDIITQKTGVAAVLQYLDSFLNPHGAGGLGGLLSLSDVTTLVQLIADRLIFTGLFVGVTALGLYMLVKEPADGAFGAIRLIQSQQRLGIRREENEARSSAASARMQIQQASQQAQARQQAIRSQQAQQKINIANNQQALRQQQHAVRATHLRSQMRLANRRARLAEKAEQRRRDQFDFIKAMGGNSE